MKLVSAVISRAVFARLLCSGDRAVITVRKGEEREGRWREAEIEGSVRDGQSLLSRLLTTIAFDMWADCGLAVEFRIVRVESQMQCWLSRTSMHSLAMAMREACIFAERGLVPSHFYSAIYIVNSCGG